MRIMKNLLIIGILLAAAVIPVYGQRAKNIVYRVGVGELIYTPPSEKSRNSAGEVIMNVTETLLTGRNSQPQPQFAEAVRASVMAGLSKVMRFRAFDGSFTEEELAAGIPALFVDGTITNISSVSRSETKKDSKGETHTDTYYLGLVSVTVNIKDAYDGTVVDSFNFNISDSDDYWMASAENAITSALKRLTSRIAVRYNHQFPLYASIIEVGEAKKNKLKEVYIDLGSADGVYKGMQFDVFTVRVVAGNEARTQIGRIKIEDVQGDNICFCKVNKGGDKIKTALDEGQTLVVTSR